MADTISHLDEKFRLALSEVNLVMMFFDEEDIDFDEIAKKGSSMFCEGPCMDLALAVHEWLGDAAVPYFVEVPTYYPRHCAVRVGDYAIDGDGIRRWEFFLETITNPAERVNQTTWTVVLSERQEGLSDELVFTLNEEVCAGHRAVELLTVPRVESPYVN